MISSAHTHHLKNTPHFLLQYTSIILFKSDSISHFTYNLTLTTIFNMLKKIILGLIAILVLIQFIRIDKTNPPVNKSIDFITLAKPSEEVQGILVTSCYDCHSNETTYPWYTDVAPLSWWLKHHINEGREHLNFSEWGNYTEKRQQHKLEECIEEVNEGEMPLSSYTIMHKDAALSPAQQKALSTWVASLIKKK